MYPQAFQTEPVRTCLMVWFRHYTREKSMLMLLRRHEVCHVLFMRACIQVQFVASSREGLSTGNERRQSVFPAFGLAQQQSSLLSHWEADLYSADWRGDNTAAFVDFPRVSLVPIIRFAGRCDVSPHKRGWIR